ncbi:UNVERIFIED_CONTAM: hypothetical protein Sradi_2173700 [Sesamum radiatum]|uniref:Uncharacterized protein n=1 Tax=Sesamum radiatum TaxID=300843 RepID=A0AAW2T0Y9_SESRA
MAGRHKCPKRSRPIDNGRMPTSIPGSAPLRTTSPIRPRKDFAVGLQIVLVNNTDRRFLGLAVRGKIVEKPWVPRKRKKKKD